MAHEDSFSPTSSPGTLKTLLAATAIVADATTNHTPVTRLEHYRNAIILLTLASKTMDAATTLDIYLQYSPDEGTTWDDLVHFAQVTNAAMGAGSYVVVLSPIGSGAGAVDRVVTDGTLAANSIRNQHWCDRIRVKTVSVNFGGTDTIIVTVKAFMF